MALIVAGFAEGQPSTYWVPWISTADFLNVDGTDATDGDKATCAKGNPSEGMMMPGKMSRKSPVTTLASLPNWTVIVESEEKAQTGFFPNLTTVEFAKRPTQFVIDTLVITG